MHAEVGDPGHWWEQKILRTEPTRSLRTPAYMDAEVKPPVVLVHSSPMLVHEKDYAATKRCLSTPGTATKPKKLSKKDPSDPCEEDVEFDQEDVVPEATGARPGTPDDQHALYLATFASSCCTSPEDIVQL